MARRRRSRADRRKAPTVRVWTYEEEQALAQGVKKHGRRYKFIKTDPQFTEALKARSYVDMKQKWFAICDAFDFDIHPRLGWSKEEIAESRAASPKLSSSPGFFSASDVSPKLSSSPGPSMLSSRLASPYLSSTPSPPLRSVLHKTPPLESTPFGGDIDGFKEALERMAGRLAIERMAGHVENMDPGVAELSLAEVQQKLSEVDEDLDVNFQKRDHLSKYLDELDESVASEPQFYNLIVNLDNEKEHLEQQKKELLRKVKLHKMQQTRNQRSHTPRHSAMPPLVLSAFPKKPKSSVRSKKEAMPMPTSNTRKRKNQASSSSKTRRKRRF